MKDTILARDLPRALDGRGDVRTLSLDCFDTLLWRDAHAPSDVFHALHGPNQMQRVWAEQRARAGAAVRYRRSEVSISEIYAELLPNASLAEQSAMADQELAAEASLCFGFLPTIELMRVARARGMSVIVVSDTYLDAEQLRALIAAAAGDEVAALIDRIFCSSVYGVSKSNGLLSRVLKELGVRSDTVLHIGDNRAADLVAARKIGIQALHLKQFTTATEQRLRLEAAVGAMIHAGGAKPQMNIQPHRAAIAAGESSIVTDAEALGFSGIGPVLQGFAHWLAHEATALRSKCSGEVHVLFLMRDGHLPRLVFEKIGTNGPSHAVEISRFTANVVSFASEADVLAYLEAEIGTDADAILRQLLFKPSEAAVILRALPTDGRHAALVRAIRTEARMKRVLTRSQAFARRMINYLRAMIAPAASDTLMLVDLGYNGSVQNRVEPLLRQSLNVEVAGRYLLLREQDMPGLDKRGFISQQHYDANTLEALCGNVAVLEQLCTAAQGSVVDYTDDGLPVRAANSIKGGQSATRELVQKGAIQYAGDARREIVRRAADCDGDALRTAAVAVLARLMFLPMPQELAVLKDFQQDVNLGMNATVPLFDPEVARRGLRQRGLFYMRGSERMYLPAELQGEGLAVKLTLLAHKRFGLALKYADFIDQTITLPVLIADGRKVDTATITATPTHDGYYIAPIPIDDCRYSIGLQFGRLYEWLQIESVVFMPVDRFLSERQRPGVEEIAASPTLEGMERTAAHLFRCEDNAAFMMVPPPPRKDARAMMLAVVFRPIVARETATYQAGALADTTGEVVR